jgi:Thiamine monophosphate synthase
MNWIPQGLENLRYWVAVSDVPVVAIAGIHAGNLTEIAQTGADAAAVIQAVVSMPRPRPSLSRPTGHMDSDKRLKLASPIVLGANTPCRLACAPNPIPHPSLA